MRKYLLAALFFTSTSVVAAPFCLVTSYGTNCYYYDMDSCQQAAGNQGACIVNSADVKLPQNGGPPFCAVLPYGTNCYYYDAQKCQEAATLGRGACVVNPNR